MSFSCMSFSVHMFYCVCLWVSDIVGVQGYNQVSGWVTMGVGTVGVLYLFVGDRVVMGV